VEKADIGQIISLYVYLRWRKQ